MDYDPPYMGSTRHSENARLMYIWTQQKLEQYFLNNPEKAIAMSKSRERHQLCRIVIDLMETCPHTHYNIDYRNDWLTLDMMNCLRRTVARIEKEKESQ